MNKLVKIGFSVLGSIIVAIVALFIGVGAVEEDEAPDPDCDEEFNLLRKAGI